MKEFLDSYFSCIEKMSFETVKPFTESEIQPNYSAEWLKTIEILANKILENPGEDYSHLLMNKSIIRSMLVMDLLDCAFTNNKELAHKIFDAYSIIINQCYETDPYSKVKNTPRGKLVSHFRDLNYTNNTSNKFVAHWCFNMAYLKWQDIYADNTYEITGPYHLRDYTYICQDFRLLGGIDGKDHIRIVSRFDKINIYDIQIDMFGHLVYKLHEPILPHEFISLNGEEVKDTESLSKLLQDEYVQLIRDMALFEPAFISFLSRQTRYVDLFNIFTIDFDQTEISVPLLKNIKKYPRLEVTEIKKLLNTLLND